MKDWLTPKETDQQLVSHKILANEHALTDPPPLAHHIWCQKTLVAKSFELHNQWVTSSIFCTAYGAACVFIMLAE